MLELKRIFSAFVGVAMAANALITMPFSAFADETTSGRTYIYDDYEITYNVTNSWGNTEAIYVTITNTGDNTIENWMLAYDDFNGEISGIWDAKVAETDSGYEYVRNVGYNANIAPNQSINFGYTLDDYTGIPDTVIMAQDRLEKPSSGFSAELNVISEWGSTFQGEIVLTNDTNKPMEWWELTFDSNFTITEVTTSWAASVVDNGDCNYTFKGTYTGIVDANSSVALGFQAIKNGTPMIDNISLTEVVFSNSIERSEDDLVDIGEAYYKDIESLDEIETDENGIEFVKNQFLLTAYNDVAYDDVEALGNEYDADIVGYIELTNDYQFEIEYDVDASDIYQIIDELMDNQLVEYASLNTVIESGDLSLPNDPWKTSETVDWDATDPSGSNWGLEAIDVPGAWEYIDKMSTVKVGLIDSEFQEHEDLEYFHIFNNVTKFTEPHGNHVAGTMAADFDNEIGISGIIPYNKLYAVSRTGSRAFSGEHYTAMEWKYMFAFLIGNNVKVINVSHRDYFNAAAGDSNADILGEFLNKLINMGYDFNIVAAAGNSGVNSDSKDISLINRISIEKVKNRIIVVGSIWRNTDGTGEYQMSSFSSRGERVDVVAPGGELYKLGVYSTVFNNSYSDENWCGTSMAAPHVSGTAALLYSVNPNLSGEQVKNIIVETSGGEGREFTDSLGGSYGIVNAKLAVETALNTEGENAPKNESIIFVRDYLSGTRLNDATIRIQGTEAQNNDVDLYLTEGKPTEVITGWYNITVMADGYVTYRYKYHSSEGFTTIDLVEDIADSTGYLQITAKDWINNQNANTEFNLYTIDENHNQVQQNLNGTYATTNGVTNMMSLAPGYYLPETTTGSSQYVQDLYPVAANHTTNEICMKFGFEGTVETYGFEVYVEDSTALGINFRLAARSSEESLRLDEAIIATNIHPVNYPGVYFHFFDTQQIRDSKVFSIGFKLTQAQIDRISDLSNNNDFGIKVMISHGLYGTPSSDPIWMTAGDLVNNWDSQTGFVQFADISFDNEAGEYTVSSDYWLLDSED
jgi:subtilisin family serine protease